MKFEDVACEGKAILGNVTDGDSSGSKPEEPELNAAKKQATPANGAARHRR